MSLTLQSKQQTDRGSGCWCYWPHTFETGRGDGCSSRWLYTVETAGKRGTTCWCRWTYTVKTAEKERYYALMPFTLYRQNSGERGVLVVDVVVLQSNQRRERERGSGCGCGCGCRWPYSHSNRQIAVAGIDVFDFTVKTADRQKLWLLMLFTLRH